jgi:hypothetical protein
MNLVPPRFALGLKVAFTRFNECSIRPAAIWMGGGHLGFELAKIDGWGWFVAVKAWRARLQEELRRVSVSDPVL